MNRERNARIVFFVPEWPASNSGVLRSQVLSVAKFLLENRHDCLFVGSDVSVNAANQAAIAIKNIYGVDSIIYKNKWNIPGFIGHVLNANATYHRAASSIREFKPTHIYCRSPIESRFGRKIAKENNATSIFDVRAALAEEVRFRRKKKGLRYFLMGQIEFTEYRKADRLSCVSENLKNYIASRVGRKDAVVIPSCFDKNRFYYDEDARSSIRRTLNISADQKVICYVGSLFRWQRIEDILELFAKLAVSDRSLMFLFLTEQVEELNALISSAQIPIENCFVLSVPNERVFQYLSASDIGIIMREDTIVNNVASPIKVGEYLACGLSLILTRGIGDFSELIPKKEIGLALDENEDTAHQVLAFLSKLDCCEARQRAVEFGRNYLSIESHLQDYNRLYS